MRSQIELLLEKTPELARFSDMAGSTIVTDIAVRQQMLTELNVTNRLAIMAAYLVRLICPN